MLLGLTIHMLKLFKKSSLVQRKFIKFKFLGISYLCKTFSSWNTSCYSAKNKKRNVNSFRWPLTNLSNHEKNAVSSMEKYRRLKCIAMAKYAYEIHFPKLEYRALHRPCLLKEIVMEIEYKGMTNDVFGRLSTFPNLKILLVVFNHGIIGIYLVKDSFIMQTYIHRSLKSCGKKQWNNLALQYWIFDV